MKTTHPSVFKWTVTSWATEQSLALLTYLLLWALMLTLVTPRYQIMAEGTGLTNSSIVQAILGWTQEFCVLRAFEATELGGRDMLECQEDKLKRVHWLGVDGIQQCALMGVTCKCPSSVQCG